MCFLARSIARMQKKGGKWENAFKCIAWHFRFNRGKNQCTATKMNSLCQSAAATTIEAAFEWPAFNNAMRNADCIKIHCSLSTVRSSCFPSLPHSSRQFSIVLTDGTSERTEKIRRSKDDQTIQKKRMKRSTRLVFERVRARIHIKPNKREKIQQTQKLWALALAISPTTIDEHSQCEEESMKNACAPVVRHTPEQVKLVGSWTWSTCL